MRIPKKYADSFKSIGYPVSVGMWKVGVGRNEYISVGYKFYKGKTLYGSRIMMDTAHKPLLEHALEVLFSTCRESLIKMRLI